MRRFVSLVLSAAFILVFSACAAEKKETRPVAQIYADIEAADVLPEMLTLTDEFIMSYYGIDTKTLDEYVFSIAAEAVRADVVILIRTSQNTDALAETLRQIHAQKGAEMENYLPDQYQVVKKSEVVVSDGELSLVISPDRDTIYQLINQ